MCALGLAAAPATAGAEPAIMEFSAGLGELREPSALAAGPDGNLWYTAEAESGGDGGVGRISPLGVVTEFTDGLEDVEPDSIAAGPDGNLWFTDPERPSIGRITPQGKVTVFPLLKSAAPRSIAAGPDGNLWFTDDGIPARIGRITPAGVVTGFVVGLHPVGRPGAIAAGPDGNMWFTERGGGGRIGRIAPDGTITEFSAGLTPGAEPQHIAPGADGNLWFTEGNGQGRIGRITPDGAITEFTAGLSSSANIFGIAGGRDGNLWFTVDGPRDAVGRMSPSGAVRLVTNGLSRDAGPRGIAWGPDAAVWFAELDTDRIGRLDPSLADAEDAPAGPGSSGRDGNLVLAPGAAPPKLGRSVVVQVLSGRVRVRRPGGPTVPLVAGGAVPVNAELDTTSGRLRVFTALPGSRFQTAEFWGGKFALQQGRDGTTHIFVRDLPQGCTAGSRAAKSARRRRGLWTRDRRGRFRTHGRNSVATVRGTTWLTTETCRGTLTTVTEGAVSVRDRHTRRTVLVRPGHAYLARRR